MARGTVTAPAPTLNLGIKPILREFFAIVGKAFSNDIVLVLTPDHGYTGFGKKNITTAAWTHKIFVELQTAAGEIHTWFNLAIANGVSIADAGGGTATIPSTTLTFVNGIAEIVVSGNAATWAAGETFTLTVPTFTILGVATGEKTAVVTFVDQENPSYSPSLSPSKSPSLSPSLSPSKSPSLSPSKSPSLSPSTSPSKSPSLSPSLSPSASPST